MTKDDALVKLVDIARRCNGDTEGEHCEGDQLVADVLRSLGYVRFADAYDKVREQWWYA